MIGQKVCANYLESINGKHRAAVNLPSSGRQSKFTLSQTVQCSEKTQPPQRKKKAPWQQASVSRFKVKVYNNTIGKTMNKLFRRVTGEFSKDLAARQL